MNTVTWAGYDFTVYASVGIAWNNVAGIYIFTGVVGNQWEPYYIGQCDSFQNRLRSHERWGEAARLGATHVHARVVPLAANRDSLEAALIRACQPPLNDHFR